MLRHTLQNRIARWLAKADVIVNGDQPWDLQVHDDRLWRRVAARGLVGFSDAYVDGWWDCQATDQLYERCLRADLPSRLWLNHVVLGRWMKEKLFNLQSPRRAFRNGQLHYDLGDDLFAAMLDRRMIYSCAYWQCAGTLDQAQETKLELICRKLQLEPGMRVLDIGCGWGGFAQFAAERHDCEVVGITVSDAQVALACQRCRGLPVEIHRQDYRDLNEPFDRIISIGMFEHVGQKNHRSIMHAVHRCLKRNGLCLLHFFATQRSWPNLHDSEVIWISRNIFPNMVVPSMKQVGAAMEGLFVIEDLHNFGEHYDPTLMAWFENFNENWPRLRDSYGERFYRMWKHYLLSCAGAFRSRKYQLWQIVLSKHGVPGGYAAVRDVPAVPAARSHRLNLVAQH